MNKKTAQDCMEQVYSCMDSGDYSRAAQLAEELCTEAKLMGWLQLQTNAVEMMLVAYIEQNNLDKALKIGLVLKQLPATAYGLYLLARLELMAGRNANAYDMAEKALKLANENRSQINPLVLEKIYNLMAKTLSFYGDSESAARYYLKSVDKADSLQLKALEYSNYLFNLHYFMKDAEQYYNAHLGYGDLFKEIKQFKHDERYKALKTGTKKIRIGYISPDIRYHVVLRFCAVMMTAFNRDEFEVFCYLNNYEDGYSESIKQQVNGWRNIKGLSASKTAEIIYNDNIDILFDLAGHTSQNSLPALAYKPAPVQVSGIGYFATTGLGTIDYFLSDKYLASDPECFVEKILELEHSHFCYTPLYETPEISEAPCLKKGYVTFGSFNNCSKLTDEVISLWADIIRNVPDAHLLLKDKAFDDLNGLHIFYEKFLKAGIDVHSKEWSNRIEFRGFSKDYLKEYADIDIALDTFPYPGGGTTCDALYMGVPVITLNGASHGERFGSSILINAGLSECVAQDKQQYWSLAVGLASDKETINALHLVIRKMMINSPLMNQSQYMGELEAAYKYIWNSYVNNFHS